jgi:hypothetical protein
MSTLRVETREREGGTFAVYLMGKSRRYAHAQARCASAVERDAKVTEFEGRIQEHEAELAAKRKARCEAKRAALESFGNPYKVGEILYNSWGYDQTNIDFYEVVEVKGRSVMLRPVAGETTETGFMCGHKTPRPGEFCGEPMRKMIQFGTRPYLAMKYGGLYPYEGKPVGCSWYA